jgi:hypothetical protein
MHMSLSSHHAHTFLRSLTLVAGIGLSVTTAACASSPTPPPAAAAQPPSSAFDQAAGKGATNAQPPGDDGVVFVDQDHKDPTTHSDDTPVTPLQATTQTARPKP